MFGNAVGINARDMGEIIILIPCHRYISIGLGGWSCEIALWTGRIVSYVAGRRLGNLEMR